MERKVSVFNAMERISTLRSSQPKAKEVNSENTPAAREKERRE